MTEQEWLECTDPRLMLEFLRGRGSDRKLRLYQVACCRFVWDSIGPLRVRRAVETAERYADGNVCEEELVKAYSLALQSANNFQAQITHRRMALRGNIGVDEARLFMACDAAHSHKPVLIGRLKSFCRHTEFFSVSPGLLREIFGNPLHVGRIDPRWLTSTVIDLARAIYDEKAFDRMPILGDALMDAGCDDEEIIVHCRGEGLHVRGCWVVDLLLGKE